MIRTMKDRHKHQQCVLTAPDCQTITVTFPPGLGNPLKGRTQFNLTNVLPQRSSPRIRFGSSKASAIARNRIDRVHNGRFNAIGGRQNKKPARIRQLGLARLFGSVSEWIRMGSV
jgi:hypothetical protein